MINKLTKQKLNMMNLIRKDSRDIVVPPICVINYFGLRYVIYMITPVSRDTLEYGTITQNLLVNNFLADAKLLSKIAESLNLENHFVSEDGTGQLKNILLTSNMELHRVSNNLVLTDLEFICPPEYFDYAETPASDLYRNLSKFLRIETLQNCHEPRMRADWLQVSTKNPPKCSNCFEYIAETEYLYFEKRSLHNDKKIFRQFYACVTCFHNHKA